MKRKRAGVAAHSKRGDTQPNKGNVVFGEVLCVEKFEVDVACPFAKLLPAVGSVWIHRFSLLQLCFSNKKFLRCSPSLLQILPNSVQLQFVFCCEMQVLFPESDVDT